MSDYDNIYFNYAESKAKYILGLQNRQRFLSKYHPYTEESKKEIISYVEQKINPYYTKYEVIKDNNNALLILKRRMADVPAVEILPATKCFDVMAEAHLIEDHANIKKMTAILKPIYYIPPNLVNTFLKACNVCSSKKQLQKIRIRSRWHTKYIAEFTVYCGIFPIQTGLDNGLSHVIVYVDAFTNYVLLRPTYSKDHQVVAYEVLKFFLDFGLPENITVCNSDEYFETLMSILKSTDIFLKLPSVNNRKNVPYLNWAMENTFSLLQSWINTCKSSNWAIGLKEIQWQLNSSIDDNIIIRSRKITHNIVTSPYHAHFGFLPNKKGIQKTYKIPKTVQVELSTQTKNKMIAFDDSCLKCGEKVYEVYYKTCVVCKRKCHFNCCVISIHELTSGDYKLEVTCMSCEELKNIT